MELPEQLKANRERIGLSQEDVAHAIFVSRQTMSSWEATLLAEDTDGSVTWSSLYVVPASVWWLGSCSPLS